MITLRFVRIAGDNGKGAVFFEYFRVSKPLGSHFGEDHCTAAVQYIEGLAVFADCQVYALCFLVVVCFVCIERCGCRIDSQIVAFLQRVNIRN